MKTVLQEPLKLVSGLASLNTDWLAPLDTLAAVASNTHGTFSLSFAAPVQSSDSWSLLVGITREGADGSVVSTNYGTRGVELELAAFVNAIEGTDDGLGTPLSALKGVGLLQATLENQGKPIDLQEVVPEL